MSAGFLRGEFDQYDVAADGSIVVEPGSDCERFEQNRSGADEAPDGTLSTADCRDRQKTLETAVEAYVAQTGALPADQRALVDEGFLRDPIDEFDVLPDGSVVVVQGAGCV